MDVLKICSHAHWFITRRQSSHIKSFQQVRFGGNNLQTADCSTSLNRNVVVVSLNGSFFAINAILGKMCIPVAFFCVYCTIKNDYKKSSFVNSMESFCQKNSKQTLSK